MRSDKVAYPRHRSFAVTEDSLAPSTKIHDPLFLADVAPIAEVLEMMKEHIARTIRLRFCHGLHSRPPLRPPGGAVRHRRCRRPRDCRAIGVARNIERTAPPIPEPSTLALLGFGLFSFLLSPLRSRHSPTDP